MNELMQLVWVEQRKAFRSRMPLYTALVTLLMPLGFSFLIFVSKNPDISRKLGLISTKATLMADTASTWPVLLSTFAEILGIGGMMLTVFIVSWVFGREFVDGTLKDLLAVPVRRSTILLAKFIVAAIWSAALGLLILVSGLLVGVAFHLPGATSSVLLQGCQRALITSWLGILIGLPFAFFAGVGRGYFLPIGAMILTLVTSNLVTAAGWGEYFPWAAIGIYSQGKDPLPSASFVIIFLTGLVGLIATYLWWKFSDQNK